MASQAATKPAEDQGDAWWVLAACGIGAKLVACRDQQYATVLALLRYVFHDAFYGIDAQATQGLVVSVVVVAVVAAIDCFV